MDFICNYCNKIFIPNKNGAWKKRKYCSPKHSQLGQIGKKVTYTKEWRANISKSTKGKSKTEEHKKKISQAHIGTKKPWIIIKNKKHSGENSYNWRGGISSMNSRLRQTDEHQNWIKKVLYRDNYKCVKCGSNKNLQADHIKPFSIFPELRLDLSNGQTLCKDCHKVKTKQDWELIKKLRREFTI